MTVNKETARQRALAKGMLIAPQAIRERVIGGDAMFAQRILLTALIRGNEEIRSHILEELGPEHFYSHIFELLFRWVSQELNSKGQIEEAALYQKMESYVRDHWDLTSASTCDGSQYSSEEVMPGYLTPIDHVLAIEMPDLETIDHAIASLQKYYRRRLARSGKSDVSEIDQTI